MSKINIIQFTPYLPPHTGWLETVAQQIWFHWKDQGFGDIIQVTTSCRQDEYLKKYENIRYKWWSIWYEKEGIKYIIIPSFELVSNFPVYNFFHPKTYFIYRYLRSYRKTNASARVITHTRFFLTTFFWGVFAKNQDIPFFHIEHGSWHAKLWSSFKTKIGIAYDKTLWKWSIKKATGVLAISQACKKFVKESFIDRHVEVFYRWMDIPGFQGKKKWDIKLVFIWRLVSLKWVSDLIEAYKNIDISKELFIIWDGEQREKLKKLSRGHSISFLWAQNSDFVIEYLQKHKCIVVNPSYQEWLPTTVIEALITKNPVVASNVWWTSEISAWSDLILFEPHDIWALEWAIIKAIHEYDTIAGESFENVSNKFSWEKNISQLYQYIK